MGSKQSSQEEEGKQEPLPWTLHRSWDPTWSFLTDASRLEVYTFDKDKRLAKRENEKDRGFLPLFVKPRLAVGKVCLIYLFDLSSVLIYLLHFSKTNFNENINYYYTLVSLLLIN